MVKTRRVASAARAGLILGTCLVGLVSAASAMTVSDRPASILMWPKIVYDPSQGVDTLVDISNVSSNLVGAHCWLINATSHCAQTALNAGMPCNAASDCSAAGGGYAACVPGWSEIDFEVNITPDQPLAWLASQGLSPCRGSGCGPCDPATESCGLRQGEFPLNARGQCVVMIGGKPNPTGQLCNPSVPSSSSSCAGAGATCMAAISNAGSAVPPVPEAPFVGALKCVQYDPVTEVPEQSSKHNALIGHEEITSYASSSNTEQILYQAVGAERFNAVGLRHLNSRAYNGAILMDGDMYAKCPATLVLDHPFDGSPTYMYANAGGPSITDLTLLPCGDDYLRQIPGQSVAQILVMNEFEQRLSASKKVDCFYESILSEIDTGNPTRSIFSFNVQGTLVGQTWIRGTGSAATGHGLVGAALSSGLNFPDGGAVYLDSLRYDYGSGVGLNLWQKGDNSGSDSIVQP